SWRSSSHSAHMRQLSRPPRVVHSRSRPSGAYAASGRPRECIPFRPRLRAPECGASPARPALTLRLCTSDTGLCWLFGPIRQHKSGNRRGPPSEDDGPRSLAALTHLRYRPGITRCSGDALKRAEDIQGADDAAEEALVLDHRAALDGHAGIERVLPAFSGVRTLVDAERDLVLAVLVGLDARELGLLGRIVIQGHGPRLGQIDCGSVCIDVVSPVDSVLDPLLTAEDRPVGLASTAAARHHCGLVANSVVSTPVRLVIPGPIIGELESHSAVVVGRRRHRVPAVGVFIVASASLHYD